MGLHHAAGTPEPVPNMAAPQLQSSPGKDCRAAGLGHPTHPQDVDPVVVRAEIHAELDQELAHLQDKELLLAQQGLASPGPFPTPSTAGAAPGMLQSLPSAPPLHRSQWAAPCRYVALPLGWDCWSSTHGCCGMWHLLSLCWL